MELKAIALDLRGSSPSEVSELVEKLKEKAVFVANVPVQTVPEVETFFAQLKDQVGDTRKD